MKKILSFALVLTMLFGICLSFASCGGDNTFVIATSPDFAPMEFVDTSKTGNAKYVGFDILLANYIAKEMGKTLVIKPMAFDACMAALEAGNVDAAISGFSWTAKRAETFEISDYYVAGENETEQVIITKTANAGQWTTLEDYSGKKVGGQGGSLQELLVQEQIVPVGGTYVPYEDINMAFAALMNGTIDALAVAKGNGDALIASSDGAADFTGFQFELDEKYKNNVILIKKGNTALLNTINELLENAMSANVYDTWYEACTTYGDITTIDAFGYTDEGKKIVGFDENDNPIVADDYTPGEPSSEDAAKKVAYETILAGLVGESK